MLPHPGPAADGPSMGWGWVGGNPLWVYFHIGYRILDIYIYIYIYSYNQRGSRNHRINVDLEIIESKMEGILNRVLYIDHIDCLLIAYRSPMPMPWAGPLRWPRGPGTWGGAWARARPMAWA